MEKRWCTHCGEVFPLRAQNPKQSYCAKADCQRERRRLWQQVRRKSDIDYIKNQAEAHSAWASRNPDYWREYRKTHPDYTESNRKKQQQRNFVTRQRSIAKNTSSNDASHLRDGICALKILDHHRSAEEEVWTVELRMISGALP